MEQVLQDKVEKRRQRLQEYKDSEEANLETEFKELEADKIQLTQRRKAFQDWKESYMASDPYGKSQDSKDQHDKDHQGEEHHQKEHSRNIMGLMSLRRMRRK